MILRFIKEYSSFHLAKKNVFLKTFLMLGILFRRSNRINVVYVIFFHKDRICLWISSFFRLAEGVMMLFCNFYNSVHISFFFYNSFTILWMMLLFNRKAREFRFILIWIFLRINYFCRFLGVIARIILLISRRTEYIWVIYSLCSTTFSYFAVY